MLFKFILSVLAAVTMLAGGVFANKPAAGGASIVRSGGVVRAPS
jgi:hypothetical protein